MRMLNLTLVALAVLAALGMSSVADAKAMKHMKPAKNMCSTGHPIKSGGGITFMSGGKGRVCG